ncbi:O-acetyltransferase [Aspergillus heteromorphus CBS 117.55]|uniref:O-acetyltransferase n=1 Tax=Aspergillus heteromorphus CBS 117.55 TaxID=1448321 RepID=A0A317VIQ3_9EURO|nr:O-acetyltransferase [Aspergillus heteromorphus CBS 117.55]PWY71720.1 O-acetyltransferase [Aspergillus heteromorphus CBS 117.55]
MPLSEKQSGIKFSSFSQMRRSGLTSQTLSPLDHTVPKVYFTFYLSFPLKDPQRGVRSLQKGLANLTELLPFLTKDVAPSHDDDRDHDNVHCIQPPSAASQAIPMLRIRNHITESVRTMMDTATCTGIEDVRFSERYAPLPSVLDPGNSQPILRFVANVMTDGIILALTFNHRVSDGTGIGNVLEALSLCCQSDHPPLIPHQNDLQLRRQLLSPSRAVKQSVRDFAETYSPEQPFHCIEGDKWSTAMDRMAKELDTFRFRFSNQQAKSLKKACASLLTKGGSGDEPPSFLSCYDVMTALLTLSLRQSEGHKTTEEEDFTVAHVVNARSRMDPPYPPHYMGNMVTMAIVSQSGSADLVDISKASAAAKELGISEDELVQIANMAANMRRKLIGIDDQYVRGVLAHLQEQRDWSKTYIKGGDISYSSIRHLRVFDFDFGPELGKVADFRLFFGLLDKFCLVLPAGPGNDWDMQVSLDPIFQQVLRKNRLFRWALKH